MWTFVLSEVLVNNNLLLTKIRVKTRKIVTANKMKTRLRKYN